MRVCESHVTFCCLDSNIAFLRTRLPWARNALSTFGCTNLCLRLLCIHPSMLHICSHAENTRHHRTQFLREPCQVFKQNLSLFIHDILHDRFHPGLLRTVHISLREGSFGGWSCCFASCRSYFFRTDCLLPCHKFTLHGLESRTNHFTISIFYCRKSLDDLERVLSRRIVMFHAAECFVHDEANCAQVREAYSTVQ